MQSVFNFTSDSDENRVNGDGSTVISPAMLTAFLQSEFTTLNMNFFDNKLDRPDLVISKRKAFGGYYRPRDHRIVISWQAYLDHGYAEVLNTFRHEVAHITHLNHSKSFWELAVKIGCTKRHAAAPLSQPRTPHKYIYLCPTCSRRYFRNRRITRASCGACDKRFNPLHTLKLIPKSQ